MDMKQGIADDIARTIVGVVGLSLVAAGAWGLWGWPAACLVVGLPIASFYVAGEALLMLARKDGRDAG